MRATLLVRDLATLAADACGFELLSDIFAASCSTFRVEAES
jgi:hypothetical protein